MYCNCVGLSVALLLQAMNSANPFTYSAQGNQVNGNVKTISLTNCDGTPIQVEDSLEPIVLWMDGGQDCSSNRVIVFALRCNIVERVIIRLIRIWE